MSLPAEPSCQCLRAHAFVFVCVCVHVFVCPREEKEGERDGGGGHLLYTRLFGDSRVDETRAICDPKPHSLREEAAIVTPFFRMAVRKADGKQAAVRASERNVGSGAGPEESQE